jgi:6-pyruvoyl-tetrahydropterin synthase
MGHRLSQQPDSKCFHLHGHSWWIELEIEGEVDDKGMVINFADVKKPWRDHLDSNFDHHLCLNIDDPFFKAMYLAADNGGSQDVIDPQTYEKVLTEWGLTAVPFDPTVENMARLWGQWAEMNFRHLVTNPTFSIVVQEAATNKATWRSA